MAALRTLDKMLKGVLPKAEASSSHADRRHRLALVAQGAAAYGCVAVWIGLSATVILYNKWILAYGGFPFPVTLTMWHMAFCSALAALLVRGGWVSPEPNMTRQVYLEAIVPIGVLFAMVLWLGNAAYMHLSVSFIQMLKALMPVTVFGVGCVMKTETYRSSTMANMLVVTAGVAIASYGEAHLVVLGVALQLASIVAEAARLTLVQILLQKRGLKLNPITSLYYIAPCCFAFLALPWALIEGPQLLRGAAAGTSIGASVLLSNAAAAFALNLSVFLLIGKTSALTMNVAGVVKDWLLIGLSVALYASPVSALNLLGYLLAFAAVCWYNYEKVQSAAAAKEAAAGGTAAETEPLVKPETVKGGGTLGGGPQQIHVHATAISTDKAAPLRDLEASPRAGWKLAAGRGSPTRTAAQV